MADGFQSFTWRLSYRTSALNPDGKPTDILHEFYIPALRLATTYDRVAGYFRSSSLAAASQGYTSFIGHNGKMRLIVGTDLAHDDVVAIIRGDEARLSDALISELQAPETWKESVKNGVVLLSYMVAAEKLEVRVAIRKNANTGEPMSMEATDDGYVHEKWFVMEDKTGNHIYGSGSLNESKTALVLNAENIDVHCDWQGDLETERVQQAQTDFERLWNNQLPHMEVKTLPDAVKEHLIKFSESRPAIREIDGTQPHMTAEPNVKEALRFAVLRDAPKMPNGKYLGMYTAPVEPWPHQEIVSRRLIETWPYSYMMCDDVGLGKTIEAALAIRSLVLTGLVKRVLIVAPASLTYQWQRELAQKAMLPFARTTASPQIKHEYIFPDEHLFKDEDLYSPDLNIISSGLVARKERTTALHEAKPYDIVLIDEAHYARRQDPKGGTTKAPVYGQLYEAISKIVRGKTKALWMATATPMQIDPIEVYDLFRLTNRVAAFQTDPTVSMRYFIIVGKLVSGESITMDEWRFIGQSYRQIEATDPYLWRFLKTTCVNSKNRKVLLKLPYATRPPKKADQKYLSRPLFAASPLSRVMLRHTRQLLEIYKNHGELKSNLATRHILPLKAISFTKTEAAFYNQLEAYCAELSRQIAKANSQSRQMTYFYLNFLQLRFASSLYAVQMTLKRRLQRVQKTLLVDGKTFEDKFELKEYLEQMRENDETGVDEDDINEITFDALLRNRNKRDLQWEEAYLNSMLERIDGMTEVPSKINALLAALESRKIFGSERLQQTVLFTRFLDSIRNIRSYLHTRNPNMRVGIYAGQFASYYNVNKKKDLFVNHEEITRLFMTGEIDLLLCTDAAAEGLNLQTADMLINFDMGWNPMKIEQRIGRIDRIGQKHIDIAVMNMCYLGSAEEIVYGRLLDRLREANLVVGMQQISMLPVKPEEFRGLADHTITEAEVTARAEERLVDQQRANTSMEITSEEQYAMYSKITSTMHNEPLSATLSDLWNALVNSPYLHTFGASFEKAGTWMLPPSDCLPHINGTIDRSAVSNKVEFITWGNPKVDMLLSMMSKYIKRYNNCIRRISVETSTGNEIVGYLVATHDGVNMITDYSTLTGIDVDVSASLSEIEISAAKKALQTYATQVSNTANKTEKVEALNINYASLHFSLVKTVSAYLLQNEQKNGELYFWPAIRDIETNAKSTQITLPSSGFVGHENELLFIVQINANEMYVPSNDLLLQSALDYAKRIADGMKVKKSELRTEDVLHRMERQRSIK